MKRSISLLSCLCSTVYCFAQTPESPFKARNTLYAEGFGSGGIYSLNYERLIKTKPKSAVGLRVGGNLFGFKKPSYTFIGEVFAIYGPGKNHLDVGLSLSALRTFTPGNENGSFIQEPYWSVYAIPRISYRYQKPQGGLMLRVGVNPFLNVLSNQDADRIGILPCFAIGHSF